MCWRARLFSAHVRPSLLATTHCSIVVCIIHEAATQLVHESLMAEMAQEQLTQEQLDVSGEVEEQEQQHDTDVVVLDTTPSVRR